MGNTNVKPHPRSKNKKQVRWKAADRPLPPGKPFLDTSTEPTPEFVSIRWTRPLKDGGSPISGYLIEHRRAGSPHWIRANPLIITATQITISGLEPGWRYQFRVFAENAVGLSDPSELSDPLAITFLKSSVTAPRFLQELSDATALENNKVEFTAQFIANPPPKVCWFKDGFEIFSSRRIRIFTENDRSILTIYQCSLLDEGEIKCTATNRAGIATCKCKLTVEAPPLIILPKNYEEGLLFELGEVIRLRVSIAGRPTPLVFWSHNGESIPTDDRYEIEATDKSSTLKIGEATRLDRGEYQIKAVNKLGDHMQSFLVTVTDKPSPPGKARVLMAMGRSVTLSWNTPFDDGGCKIGNYIIEYYRLGWNVWLKAATTRQLSTNLGDLIEGSEYKFRVKAESPYGVSEPSEETDVVFIPDPRRGILKPQPRERSLPRDIIEELATPVASRRKNKARSQSSSRVEESIRSPHVIRDTYPSNTPVRPERTKVKSPPMTPLLNGRKPPPIINFDYDKEAAPDREIAYPIRNANEKKGLDLPHSYLNEYPSSSERSTTPSPVLQNKPMNNEKTVRVQQRSRTPEKSRSPSPGLRSKSPRENTDNFTGSSEFMLVLYSDENKDQRSPDIAFDFDENMIPPPMSLSAPELGLEPPEFFQGLKLSASSTELLHERAMARFYEAAAAEEEELERRRQITESLKHGVPKIQINSLDDQEIVGLERKYSLRRRMSAGSLTQQQALWAQRRQSLRNPTELDEIIENKLSKFSSKNITNSNIVSIDKMNKAGRKIVQEQSSVETVEEYEESLMSEEESSDDDIQTFRNNVSRSNYYAEEEDETYHPGSRTLQEKLKDEQPFEILTERKNPPDPNFVPKRSILKKIEHDDFTLDQIRTSKTDTSPVRSNRSHSPMPQNYNRGRSASLVDSAIYDNSKKGKNVKTPNTRERSFSLIPQDELKNIQPTKLSRDLSAPSIQKSIAEVAKISGFAAASIVIPNKLLEKKKDDEEAKVVIDHYGDIVKSYGKQKDKPPVYLDRDTLKKYANEDNESTNTLDFNNMMTSYESIKEENSLRKKTPPNENINDVEERKLPQNRNNTEAIKATSKTNEMKYEELENTPPPVKETYNQTKEKRRTVSQSPRRRRFDKPVKNPTPSHSPTRSPSKSPTQSRSSSMKSLSKSPNQSRRSSTKSPARPENWSKLKSDQVKPRRKTSPSPMRREALDKRKSPSKSPSPVPFYKRRPMLREIMTQTSVGLEACIDSFAQTNFPTRKNSRQEELIAKAEVQVRSVVDYITDLAMFAVAVWLYIFNNELLAIPVLLIMVYRQLKDGIKKRTPKWILNRLNRKHKK